MRDLKHPWKPSVRIIRFGAIVLGSWLLEGIKICVKEPYFTIFLWETVQDRARSCRTW